MPDTVSIERAHLQQTLAYIARRAKKAELDLANAQTLLTQARSGDPDLLPVRENSYMMARELLKNLRLAADRTYFTRLDFTPEGEKMLTCYIGRYGISDPDTGEIPIYDWRAPIANLYYSGQLGHVDYTAPDGKIEGELHLKRQLEVSGGELKRVFDEDISSQDRFLQQALDEVSGDKLRDIVSTIQSEQNQVIRQPLNLSILVQGAAGSGKTTIALHRIAYLLYVYSGRLRPDQMLILAPSPLFLDYISGVLPDLGVESVAQSTYESFAMEQLPFKQRFGGNTALTQEELDFKGSLRFKSLLESFLDEYETRFSPPEGIRFGPVKLYGKAEMDRFLLVDEAGLPMSVRISIFKKQLTKRARSAAEDICDWMQKEALRRAEKLRASLQRGEELNARLNTLAESLKQRTGETKAEVRRFVDRTVSSLPTTEPLDVYIAFLKELSQKGSGTQQESAKHTLESISESKRIDRSDLAPLILTAHRMQQMERLNLRHIIIDEAQQYTPFDLWAIKRCAYEASFTLLGDLMQGLNESANSWNETLNGVFDGKCRYMELTTAYRSTRPIMTEAFKAARVYWKDININVIRSGVPVVHKTFADRKAREEEIVRVIREETLGGGTIAVIERDAERAKALYESLKRNCELRLIEDKLTSFAHAAYVSASADTKGLQFDAVIIPDAGANVYAREPRQARLLYLAITRALHRLYVFSEGEQSALLA